MLLYFGFSSPEIVINCFALTVVMVVHFKISAVATAVPVACRVLVIVDWVDTVALAVAMSGGFELVELV